MDTDRASATPEEIFRQRLREIRKAQGISQRGLVARLAEIGQDMNQAAIARIERGERKVSLDEVIAIAAAVDVAPTHMFLPIEGDERAVALDDALQGEAIPVHPYRGPPVKLAPKCEFDQVKARRWARGEIPLNPTNFRSYAEQSPGDILPSAEEASPAEQEALLEENERLRKKLGILGEVNPAEHTVKKGEQQ